MSAGIREKLPAGSAVPFAVSNLSPRPRLKVPETTVIRSGAGMPVRLHLEAVRQPEAHGEEPLFAGVAFEDRELGTLRQRRRPVLPLDRVGAVDLVGWIRVRHGLLLVIGGVLAGRGRLGGLGAVGRLAGGGEDEQGAQEGWREATQ